jgi:TonB family protein
MQKFLLWMVQVAAVVPVGLCLPKLFRIRHPRSHFIYCRFLLAVCFVLPFVQPWNCVIVSGADNQFRVSVLASIAPVVLPLTRTLSSQRIVAGVLLGGIVVKLCSFVIGLCRIYVYRLSAIRLQPAPEFVSYARRLINCDADVWLSLKDIGPFTFGVSRPTIVLPQNFLTLDEDAQRSIMCHELLHIRRNDWFNTIVEQLIGIIFWFHPAILWLLEEIRLAREKVVDAEVVRRILVRQPYIHALLAMAGVSESPDATAPFFLRRGHLVDRMRHLLMDDSVSVIRLVFSYVSVVCIVAAATFFAALSLPLSGETRIAGVVSPALKQIAMHVSKRRTMGGHIYSLNEGVTVPSVVSQVEPQYSDTAREARIQGGVLLEGIVETDGSMTVTGIGRGLEPTLDHNAIYALDQWRFKPGRFHGVPVPVRMDVEVQFNLR